MKKRLLSLLLVLVMIFLLCPATAATGHSAEDAANRLYQLGLMKGVGENPDGTQNFDLEGNLTREQAVIMLIRLLGKETEALSKTWQIPFTDVSDWAQSYVGYAYANGLANGTGATTFGGKQSITAAQYTTFVLRALGYSSETDFLWNSPWALSDAIGLTGGRYSAANNLEFVRGDMAIISASALYVKVKGGTQTLAQKINVSAPTKEEYLSRVLTDAELASLKGADPEKLRATISTIKDAVAYLDQFKPDGFSGLGGIRLDLDFVLNLHTAPEATCPQTYAAFVAWCLTDDFSGIQYVISTGMNYSVLRILPMLALPIDGGFWIYSPHGLAELLPWEHAYIVDTQVDSLVNLEEKISLPWSDPNHLQIFVADANQRTLTFSVDEGTQWATLVQGNAKMVYAISEEEKAAIKEQQIETNWANLQKHWKRFGFPQSFAPTLQRENVEALIGKDIDTVADSLKTVGDVLYYFALSGYEIVGGDMDVQDGEYFWTFNRAPETVFSTGWGNCGGTSGIFSYMLQGDYDEVGILTMTSSVEMGGGHVINYVQDGETCYVFDPQAMCLVQFTDLGAFLCIGNDVVAAGLQWQAFTNNDYRLIFAYPSVDGDMPHMGTGKIVYLPERFREKITIVYEDVSEGYRYEWRTLSETILKQIHEMRGLQD